MSLKKLKFLSILSFSIIVAVTVGVRIHLFTDLEQATFDWRARYFRGDSKGHEKVAILLIDEHSLKVMNPVAGRWPWPRYVYEDILSFLSRGGAKAVVFDILFTERGEGVGGELPELPLSPFDSVLVNSTRSNKNVIHSFQVLKDTGDDSAKNILNSRLPRDFIERFSLRNVQDSSPVSSGANMYYLPFRELYEASKGVGVVNFTPDSDGGYRRTNLVYRYQGSFFPSLALSPLLDFLNVKSISFESGHFRLSGGGRVVSIPVSEDGSYLIHPVNTFNSYSISGVFESAQKIYRGEVENLPVNPDEFKGKIVFIGASAAGAADLKKTPLGSKRPGVELHASIVSNILNNDFLYVASQFKTLLLTVFLTLSVASLVIFLPNPVAKSVTPLILCSAVFMYWIYLFKYGVMFLIVPPFIAALSSGFFSFVYLSFTEGRDRRVLTRMLSRYISPTLLQDVLKDKSFSEKANTGTSERLTILFVDIRGFTTLSEGLPPQEVVWILNRYLPEMVDVIFEHHGTVDKFIGDAIMAFWGAPVKDEDHALHAVDSAIEIFRRLERLNLGVFKNRGLPEIRVGIGIHTGEVVLGNIGSEKKLDYTIIGDNVNLASRMDGLTKVYGISVLISEATYKGLKGRVPCRIIDLVRVKGRQHPVKIYGLLCASFDPSERLKKKERLALQFEEAFEHYLNQRWQQALDIYFDLKKKIPEDKYIRIMIERCEEFQRTGVENWDGVYVMKGK